MENWATNLSWTALHPLLSQTIREESEPTDSASLEGWLGNQQSLVTVPPQPLFLAFAFQGQADLPHPVTQFYITCNKMSMSFALHLFVYLFYCVTLVSLAFSPPYKLSPIWIIITSYSELLWQLRPTWWHSPSLTFYLLILLRTQHRCLICLCFPSSCCSVA